MTLKKGGEKPVKKGGEKPTAKKGGAKISKSKEERYILFSRSN